MLAKTGAAEEFAGLRQQPGCSAQPSRLSRSAVPAGRWRVVNLLPSDNSPGYFRSAFAGLAETGAHGSWKVPCLLRSGSPPMNLNPAVGIEASSHEPRMHMDQHGFRAAGLADLPGEPMVASQCWVSLSTGVYPWLNCFS